MSSAFERLKAQKAQQQQSSAPATQPQPAVKVEAPSSTLSSASPSPPVNTQPPPAEKSEGTPQAMTTPTPSPSPPAPQAQEKPLNSTTTLQASVPQTTTSTTLSPEYDDTPMEEEEGLGIMIYGGKGDGKTSLAYSVLRLDPNAKIAVLSFDLQSNRIKKEMYNSNPNITVFDPQKYRTKESDDDNLQSAVRTFEYIRHLLTPKNLNNPFDGAIYKLKPDYILFDGLEIWKEICEMAMRAQLRYRPYEHFADWDAWRKRTDMMDDIDTIAKKLAKKAVIYTGYVKMQEVKDKAGNVTSIKEPKWAGNTKTRTGVVIYVESETTASGRTYYATVESSKIRSMPTCGKTVVGKINDQDKTVEIYGFKDLGTF